MKSKILLGALIITVLVLIGIGIYVSRQGQNGSEQTPTVPEMPPVAGQSPPGGPCGGNIRNPLTCTPGYHCAPAPGSHLPFGDVGGICVAD